MLENSRVRRPTTCGHCRLDDEGCSDASEEPGTVWNEFDVFQPRVLLEGAWLIVTGNSLELNTYVGGLFVDLTTNGAATLMKHQAYVGDLSWI